MSRAGLFTRPELAAGYWAALTALVIELLFAIPWWHPYCNKQDDGVGYYAFGIPLPYTEWGQGSSMEFDYMPQVFLLNLLIIVALAYPIWRFILTRLHEWRARPARVVAWIGVVLLGLCYAYTGLSGVVYVNPRWMLFAGGDSYFSYRPAELALLHGNRPCDGYGLSLKEDEELRALARSSPHR